MSAPAPFSKDHLIGFVGLGWMGSNFASRLLQAGWRLEAFDTVPQKLASVADKGAVAAGSVDQVVRESDIVFTSLPSSEAFETVAEQSILPLARPGLVVVDLARRGWVRRARSPPSSLSGRQRCSTRRSAAILARLSTSSSEVRQASSSVQGRFFRPWPTRIT